MVDGTPYQRELGTLRWRRSAKGEKQGRAPALGQGDEADDRHLEPGGIRDWTVYGIRSLNMFITEY